MPTFAFPNDGALAERLGTGLQNLLQRFDSARHLKKCLWSYSRGIYHINLKLNLGLTWLNVKFRLICIS